MKKVLRLLFLVIIVALVNTTVASAGMSKNFYAYQVKNVNIREFGLATKVAIESYQGQDNYVPLKDVKNAYIYSDEKCSYFIRLYPANQNTNIYVVSNEKYDVENNEVTDALKKAGYQVSKLDDSAAMKEYKFDFYILARQEKLGNFYISPDLVKPLKTGMSKLNNKLAKNNKKTSVIPYSVDSNPINLTCVDTTSYYDNDAKVSIIQKEYRLKEKENKYVHAHEYIITNKNDSTATVSVTSERLAALKDVTTEAFVDLDRIDLLDATGSFPPVLICTAGLSILCSVPNWVRLAKITKEAARYSHALPENYQLRPQGYMRILVLKYKNNPKPLNFNLKFANETYNISF